MNDILNCYRNWTFKGRTRRRQYWLWSLWQVIVYCVFKVAMDSTSGPLFMVLAAVFGVWLLTSLQPGLAVSVRRLHDLDKSGWWLCIVLIPVVGALALLVLMARKGTVGPNRFGPDPLTESKGAAAAPLWPPPPEPPVMGEDPMQPEPAMVKLPDPEDPHAPANRHSSRRNVPTVVVDPPAGAAGEAPTKLIGPSGFVAQDKKPAQVSDDPVVGWVVVVDGPGKGRWRQLGLGTNEIGRSPGARISIDFGDESVAREKQAFITFDPLSIKFYVQHGEGKNLTYLADAPVLARQILHSGQEITLGATRLRFIALCGPEFHWQVKLTESNSAGSRVEIMGLSADIRSARDLLTRRGQLTEEEVRRLLEPLLEGLALVHGAGAVHRDIKPENIRFRGDGTPVLLDFGAAREAVRERSHSMTRVFTPPYAPLEQYGKSGKQGPWTDLYALAAVVYEALSGQKIPEAVDRVKSDPLQPLSEVVRVSTPMAHAVTAALAVDPAERPQSVAEWGAMLGMKGAPKLVPTSETTTIISPWGVASVERTERGSKELPVGARIGDWRLEEMLSASSFDVVYRAQDEVLGQTLVVREYFPSTLAVRMRDGSVAACSGEEEAFASGRARFVDEARTRARVQHPNIARMLQYLEAKGTVYAAVQEVQGESLGKLMARRAPLSEEEVRALLVVLLEAVELIHQTGAVHADIHPKSILVRHDGNPILLWDLRLRDQTISSTWEVVPPYAAFEVYSYKDTKRGPWTDIYAIGAVAYEALSGQQIPDAPDRVESDPLIPLSKLTMVSAPMAGAITAALAVRASQRPQSIAQWRAMLSIHALP